VSLLLLLATMLNYMDRQTLSNLSSRIMSAFGLSKEQYGDLEFGFGVAFAAGSIFFGMLADRYSVRWLYPLVLLLWSLIGVLTGFCNDYRQLLMCRILLGFFEAGHWPCALRTTRIIQQGSGRLMSNSVLQSGGAIGAILTPLVIRGMVVGSEDPSIWRMPFLVIGSAGAIWIVLWLLSIRRGDLPAAGLAADGSRELDGGLADWLAECLANRRFWALVPVVISLNITWQLIRAWLPLFLQDGRGATEQDALRFNSMYFLAADVGCLAAGAGAVWLGRRGFSTHASRVLIYLICAVLTALTLAAAMLPLGKPLYLILLLVAAGSLGLFPCYYSLSQDASQKHMGKTSGLLGALGWLAASPLQKVFGRVIDRTKSFDEGLALVGLAPLAGILLLLVLWPPRSDDSG
jgi:sugar phosphate permease